MSKIKMLPRTDGPIIQLSDIWLSYGKDGYALRGIDLTIDKPSTNIVVGPSGSGKTTLIKVINGLLKPQRGIIKLFGVEAKGSVIWKAFRQRIGYIPQQLGLIRSYSALGNVLIGALPRTNIAVSLFGLFPKPEIDFAEECLRRVGLDHKINERIIRLSGGERQRVAIARALMQRPSIILADELTSDLDYVTAHAIMDTVEEIRRQGITILIALHDLNLATEYGQNIFILRDGQKVKELVPSELNHELIKQVFVQ